MESISGGLKLTVPVEKQTGAGTPPPKNNLYQDAICLRIQVCLPKNRMIVGGSKNPIPRVIGIYGKSRILRTLCGFLGFSKDSFHTKRRGDCRLSVRDLGMWRT